MLKDMYFSGLVEGASLAVRLTSVLSTGSNIYEEEIRQKTTYLER
jgi:hypothetical protein